MWYDQTRAKNPEFLPEQNWAANFKAGIQNVRSAAREQVDTQRLQMEQSELEQARAFGCMMADYRTKQAMKSRDFQIAQQQMQGAERQRQWDAQAEQGDFWKKMREQAVTKLGDELPADTASQERAIVAKMYELASLEALKTGDSANATEYRRRAEIASGVGQATEQDYASGVVKRPATAPEATTEKGTAQKVAEGIVGGVKTVGEGVYKHTAQDWSIFVNAAQMLAKKDGLDENEQAFLALVKQHSAESQAMKGPTNVMMHEAKAPPDELYEAYENLGLGRTLVGEMTYPGWYLLGRAGSFQGLRAIVGERTAVGATGAAAQKIATGALWAPAQLEAAIGKLIALPFKAVGKAISAATAKRLTQKAVQNPEKMEAILPTLDKIAQGGVPDADDMAKLASFDDEMGKAVSAIPEPVPTAAKQATEKVIIGGGEPYDPMKAILDFGDVDATVAKLYPQSREKAVMRGVGKIPGIGPEIARRIDPSMTPRRSIEAQAVQEYAAVFNHRINAEAPGWKAMVERVANAKFPGASSKKYLQIEDSIVKNTAAVQPKVKGASMAIGDILEKSENYVLDEPTQALADLWKLVRSNAIREYEKRGMHFPAAFRFPRMVKGAHGEQVGFPTVRLKKPRSYETMMAGREAGVEYVDDPVQVIQSFVDEVTRVVAANDFQTVVKAMGKTASERVPVSIKNWRMATANAVKDINYSIATVRRMAVTPRGAESTKFLQSQQARSLGLIDQRAPQLAQRIRAMVDMPAEQRTKEATAIVKELQAMMPSVRTEAAKARLAYSNALRRAKGPRLGAGEAGTRHPAFTGRIFSKEVATTLDELLPSRAGRVTNATRQVAEFLRTSVAQLDWSAWLYQGLPVLGRRPDIWAKGVVQSVKAAFKPESIAKFFADPKHVAFLSRNPDVAQGTHEYYAGKPLIEKLPVVGKAAGKVVGFFERGFETFGDAVRIMMGEALESGFVKAGAEKQLGTYVNRMTAVMNSKALGISGQQRAIESSWIAFAPRFLRSSLAYLGLIFEKGITGNEARRSLTQLAAGGTVSYVGFCEAIGQEPHLDPRDADFFTVKVGNRNIGIGGFMLSFIRFLGDIEASLTSYQGNEPMDLLNFHPVDSRKTNPIIKYISSKASVLSSLVMEGAIKQDYLGYELEDPEDWARWLIVEHSLPISLQSQFSSKYEEAPTNRVAVFAAEQLGLRVYPDEPFYELADKYAQQVYGQEWADLYQATKSGTYTKSKKQKDLIAHFPDLKQAYEAYQPKATKRWQAAHGLSPDEDAVKDHYADKLYGKKWDDLTKEQRLQVESYRAYDEATQ